MTERLSSCSLLYSESHDVRPQKIYRVYCYDISRKVVTADFIKAATDEEAVAQAEATGFGTKCEVWDGKRLVAQLEAERRQA